jgi:hypothetical protein
MVLATSRRQTVSQVFHGPAPRSPLRRLSVRLCRSRSTCTTQVPSVLAPGRATGPQNRVYSICQLSQVRGHSLPACRVVPVAFCPVLLGRDCVRQSGGVVGATHPFGIRAPQRQRGDSAMPLGGGPPPPQRPCQRPHPNHARLKRMSYAARCESSGMGETERDLHSLPPPALGPTVVRLYRPGPLPLTVAGPTTFYHSLSLPHRAPSPGLLRARHSPRLCIFLLFDLHIGFFGRSLSNN